MRPTSCHCTAWFVHQIGMYVLTVVGVLCEEPSCQFDLLTQNTFFFSFLYLTLSFRMTSVIVLGKLLTGNTEKSQYLLCRIIFASVLPVDIQQFSNYKFKWKDDTSLEWRIRNKFNFFFVNRFYPPKLNRTFTN